MTPAELRQAAKQLGLSGKLTSRQVEEALARADKEESNLAEALEAYTDPTHPEYDPDFDRQIRALRPDWFEGELR